MRPPLLATALDDLAVESEKPIAEEGIERGILLPPARSEARRPTGRAKPCEKEVFRFEHEAAAVRAALGYSTALIVLALVRCACSADAAQPVSRVHISA